MKNTKFILTLLLTSIILIGTGCSVDNKNEIESQVSKEENVDYLDEEIEEVITKNELKESVDNKDKEKIKKEIEEKFKEKGEDVIVHDVYAPKIEVDKDYAFIFSNVPDELRNDLIKSAEELTGLKAENFKYAKIDGEEQDLSPYYGKPFIIEIMSTTCRGCMELAPVITELTTTYPDIPILKVVTDDEGMVRDAQENNPNLKDVVLPKDENFRHKYPYDFVPTLLFINEDGYIVEVMIGSSSLSEIIGVYNMNFER